MRLQIGFHNFCRSYTLIYQCVAICCRRHNKGFRIIKSLATAIGCFQINGCAFDEHQNMSRTIGANIDRSVELNAVDIIKVRRMGRQMENLPIISFFQQSRLRDQLTLDSLAAALEVQVIKSTLNVQWARLAL